MSEITAQGLLPAEHRALREIHATARAMKKALRMALLDLQHVVTLLGYLAALARTRGDATLAAWHEEWERRLRALEDRGRAAAAAMAADPADAIAPADEGTLGRAGAKLGAAVGTVGEAIDSSRLGRLARRRAT